MGIELQRASVWKRISAFLLDIILLSCLAVGCGYLLAVITDYDGYSQAMDAGYAAYEAEYGVSFTLTADDYAAMTPEEKENFDAAYAALIADQDVLYNYNMVLNLSLLVTTVGILLAYLILEFGVPLLLGNGQTAGKKVFALCLVRNDGVKVNTMQLFARTLLGKFTIGTMIPVYVIVMLLFNTVGLLGTLLLGILLLLQVILLCATRNHTTIQDLVAGTVVVDMASQRIFGSTEELIAYTKRIHAERAQRQSY